MANFFENLFNVIEDMFETEYDANNAFKKSDRIRKMNIENELHNLHEMINCAVKRGEFETSWFIKYEENVDTLKKLGYSICRKYDDKYCISWENKTN